VGERCVWWCGFREECLDWRGVSSWVDGWLKGARLGWLGSRGPHRTLNDLHSYFRVADVTTAAEARSRLRIALHTAIAFGYGRTNRQVVVEARPAGPPASWNQY
jgi:hypothetical protein